jgi:hypothetical protein
MVRNEILTHRPLARRFSRYDAQKDEKAIIIQIIGWDAKNSEF